MYTINLCTATCTLALKFLPYFANLLPSSCFWLATLQTLPRIIMWLFHTCILVDRWNSTSKYFVVETLDWHRSRRSLTSPGWLTGFLGVSSKARWLHTYVSPYDGHKLYEGTSVSASLLVFRHSLSPHKWLLDGQIWSGMSLSQLYGF